MKTPLEILSDYSNNITSINIYFRDILHQYYIDIYKIHGVYPSTIIPTYYSNPIDLEECVYECTDFEIDNEYLCFSNIDGNYESIPLTELFGEDKE